MTNQMSRLCEDPVSVPTAAPGTFSDSQEVHADEVAIARTRSPKRRALGSSVSELETSGEAAVESPPAAHFVLTRDQWEDVQARLAELERVRGLGDADRRLTLEEVAASIRHSVATIRTWIHRHFHALYLEDLLRKDVTGHWYSTPRLVRQWQDKVVELQRQGVRFGIRAGRAHHPARNERTRPAATERVQGGVGPSARQS